MNDFNTGFFHQRHILFRAATGGFNNAHTTGDNRFDIARIIRIGEARQEGEVHTKRLVGHVIAFGNFIGQIFRRGLRQAGNDAKAAGIGNGSRHFGKADMVHAALNDRMLNAEKFSDTGFHVFLP